MKIVIIDYEMGNITSIQKALKFLGHESTLSSDRDTILSADRIILPGVGSYSEAVSNIDKKNLRSPIRETALEKRIPILGICLGMQLLSTSGEEEGISRGLDLIPGQVVKMELAKEFKLPHVGFNNLLVKKEDEILKNIPLNSHFYFVHKFHFLADNQDDVIGETDYDKNITALVRKDNIYGAQFHPEKSQKVGLQLLRNFMEEIKC